ncbi:MAG: hypothetical protein KKI07_04865 [Euryarchaeota archaeon]|nr:hypothetical protein [Euryarchaeota archaeon]
MSRPNVIISDVGSGADIGGEQAIDIADGHLRSLGRHPEDDGWRDFGKEALTSYEQRYCWVVTFFFDAWYPNSVRGCTWIPRLAG